MGIKIGDVDVASQIMESEYRIAVLERVVDLLLTRFPSAGAPPISVQEMDRIRNTVVEQLKKKYPNSGIALVGGGND